MIGKALGSCGESRGHVKWKNTIQTNATMCTVSFPSQANRAVHMHKLTSRQKFSLPWLFLAMWILHYLIPNTTQTFQVARLKPSPSLYRVMAHVCPNCKLNNAFLKWSTALQECQEWHLIPPKFWHHNNRNTDLSIIARVANCDITTFFSCDRNSQQALLLQWKHFKHWCCCWLSVWKEERKYQ